MLTEIWRQSMGSYDALLETGVDTVVGEVNMRFLAPGRFDDVLRIEGGFDGLGTTSTTLKLRFRRDDDLLVEADVRYVFVDLESWQKAPIPDKVREAAEPLCWLRAGGHERPHGARSRRIRGPLNEPPAVRERGVPRPASRNAGPGT